MYVVVVSVVLLFTKNKSLLTTDTDTVLRGYAVLVSPLIHLVKPLMSCDLSVFKILEVPSWFTINTQLDHTIPEQYGVATKKFH